MLCNGLDTSLIPNGISIGSAVFAGITTDRPTDHATRSVTTNRIYVHSMTMWPKNLFNAATGSSVYNSSVTTK